MHGGNSIPRLYLYFIFCLYLSVNKTHVLNKRFTNILAMLSPKKTVDLIVRAQRKNYSNISIPRALLPLNTMFRNLPEKSLNHITDFIDSGIEVSN